jgi:arylformamidase
MRIHDISLELRPGMVHWPGTTVPSIDHELDMDAGDFCTVSRWVLGAHTGSHVDGPSHFLAGGGDLSTVPLERLVGPARVVDVPWDVERIDAGVVESTGLDGATRVLFRTSNSDRLHSDTFDPTYVGVTPEGAKALIDRGITTIGVDYLSIECFDQTDFAAHHLLLGAGVVLAEGLDLRAVAPGDYFLCCLPLKLAGAEAAPARAVLIEGIGP